MHYRSVRRESNQLPLASQPDDVDRLATGKDIFLRLQLLQYSEETRGYLKTLEKSTRGNTMYQIDYG